eukprot:6469017-Amphidinium_carterae.2
MYALSSTASQYAAHAMHCCQSVVRRHYLVRNACDTLCQASGASLTWRDLGAAHARWHSICPWVDVHWQTCRIDPNKPWRWSCKRSLCITARPRQCKTSGQRMYSWQLGHLYLHR